MSKCANKGMQRHRKSGHTVNNNHFTGKKKKQKAVKRKGLTKKQKKAKMNSHKNKYKD